MYVEERGRERKKKREPPPLLLPRKRIYARIRNATCARACIYRDPPASKEKETQGNTYKSQGPPYLYARTKTRSGIRCTRLSLKKNV